MMMSLWCGAGCVCALVVSAQRASLCCNEGSKVCVCVSCVSMMFYIQAQQSLLADVHSLSPGQVAREALCCGCITWFTRACIAGYHRFALCHSLLPLQDWGVGLKAMGVLPCLFVC